VQALGQEVWLISTNCRADAVFMNARECKENAVNCYRLAQTMTSVDDRQALLTLMVRWQQLAEQIEQFSGANRIDTGSSAPPAFCADAEISFELQRHQATARRYH
jgi:hypothetical protein